MNDKDNIQHELFTFHKLNPDGISKAMFIADAYTNLLEELSAKVPECREWSIAKTKLEEACFFTKKAMACSPDNQAE